MFGELEDPYKSYDAEERQRSTCLGRLTAHRREYVEQGDVIRNDSSDVNDVLKVLPKVKFRRTSNKPGIE